MRSNHMHKTSFLLVFVFGSVFIIPAWSADRGDPVPVLKPLNVSPPPAVPHCEKSMLNSGKFIELIQAIITHGDLTDIPFIERTLRVKFSLQFNEDLDGKPDAQSIIYQANSMSDTPIHINLYVDYGRDNQIKQNSIGLLQIEDQLWPSSDDQFFINCLRISSSEFSSHFGGGFRVHPLTDGSTSIGAIKDVTRIGAPDSKFSLRYTYNDRKLVMDVSIWQRP